MISQGSSILRYEVSKAPGKSLNVKFAIVRTESAKKVASDKIIALKTAINDAIIFSLEPMNPIIINDQDSDLVVTDSKVQAALTTWLATNNIELDGIAIKLISDSNAEVKLNNIILTYELSKAPGTSLHVEFAIVRTESAVKVANNKIIALKTAIDAAIASTNKPLTIKDQNSDIATNHPKVQAALTTWLAANKIEPDGATIKLISNNKDVMIRLDYRILTYEISKAPGTSLNVHFKVVRTESAAFKTNKELDKLSALNLALTY